MTASRRGPSEVPRTAGRCNMSGRSDRERRDVPPICASVDKVIEQSAPALRARGERKRFRNIRSLVSYQAASAMKEHLRRLSYLWSTANSGDDDPALWRASRNPRAEVHRMRAPRTSIVSSAPLGRVVTGTAGPTDVGRRLRPVSDGRACADRRRARGQRGQPRGGQKGGGGKRKLGRGIRPGGRQQRAPGRGWSRPGNQHGGC